MTSPSSSVPLSNSVLMTASGRKIVFTVSGAGLWKRWWRAVCWSLLMIRDARGNGEVDADYENHESPG